MAITAALVKTTDGALIPATAYDAELLGQMKIGKSYKVELKEKSNRSYQHHKLFFGGLLPLAFEYWQPTSGMMREGEAEAVKWVINEICKLSGADAAVLMELAEQSLQKLARKRSDKYGIAASSLEAFRKWLTIEAGYFDVIQTPSGVRKEAKSISFAGMSQEEFNAFYKACFDVAWNMMLRAVFDSEEAAQEAAVNRMMELG